LPITAQSEGLLDMNTTANNAVNFTNNAVKFTNRHDGGWQGNGYGHCPNSYYAMVDGVELGQLHKRTTDDLWVFVRNTPTIIDGVRFQYERFPSLTANTFAELKNKVRDWHNNNNDDAETTSLPKMKEEPREVAEALCETAGVPTEMADKISVYTIS